MTPEGERFVLADEAPEGIKAISREQFSSIKLDDADYLSYVAPARQAMLMISLRRIRGR